MSDTKTLDVAESVANGITIVAQFPKVGPDELFAYLVRPELLKRWWPPVAELEPKLNGQYHFSWPKQNWNLRGEFTEYSKGKRLQFTWRWDHEPIDATTVALMFERAKEGGTKLTLNHRGYTDDAVGRKLRDEHLEGWKYFLGELQKQAGSRPSPPNTVLR